MEKKFNDGKGRSEGRRDYARSNRTEGERRNFNRNSEGGRNGDRREGSNNGERRSFSGERRNSGSRNFGGNRGGFNRGGDRRFGGDRRSFGDRREGFNRDENRGSAEGGERRSFSGERRNSGSRNFGGNRGGFNRGGDRRFGGDRRSFGDRREGFNRDENRGSAEGGERRSFSGERRNSGSRNFGGNREGFNRGGERRFDGERRSFGGDRRNSGRRNFSGNREGFSRDGERRFGGERRSFGDRGGFNRNGGRNFGGSRGGYNRGGNNWNHEDNSGINSMLERKAADIKNSIAMSDNDNVQFPAKDEIRLNKFIANSGVCSRREADNFIQAGVVTVNGEVVSELGTKVNVYNDDVRFNGTRLKGEEKVYILMNKPKGYVTTLSDPHANKTVMDLLSGCKARIFPVGRLDKNTTGVLMFTNDGELAETLTHPSYNKKKIYQVTLDNDLKMEDHDKILAGLTLNDGVIKADELEYIDEQDHRRLGIEIHSGKNRIVRRIFESLGYDVKMLDRVYFAGLTKKGLKKGDWRYLEEGEVNVLKMGAYI